MIKKSIFILASLLSVLFAQMAYSSDEILRVGTTGDYQPVTWLDKKTNQYVGFDIDMAHIIAKKLHMKLVFVKTTWKTLSEDLRNKKFDVAMGGVTITQEREKNFIFSQPVLFDKKVVVIRCVDEKKLNSWQEINQPSVHLIENQGGTNEIFARQYATKAMLTISNDNRIIFNAIMTYHADAMITDRLEADYQMHEHSDLCIVDVPLKIAPLSEKAYMLRKEEGRLRTAINEVIHEIRSKKKLPKLENKWNIARS